MCILEELVMMVDGVDANIYYDDWLRQCEIFNLILSMKKPKE